MPGVDPGSVDPPPQRLDVHPQQPRDVPQRGRLVRVLTADLGDNRTHVILLVQDLDVRVINAITGELLRELTIDPSKDYQPRTSK